MKFERLAVALCSMAVLTACGTDDDAAGPPEGIHIDATFTLQTANEQPLPAVIDEQGDDQLVLLSGSIVLNANATYTDEARMRITRDGVASLLDENIEGVYGIDDGILTLYPRAGGSHVLEIDPGMTTVRQEFSGLVLVYTRTPAEDEEGG